MQKRLILIALGLGALALALAGCNGSAGSPPSSENNADSLPLVSTGEGAGFTFHVEWPETSARLIPKATSFLAIGILDKTEWDQGNWAPLGHTMLDRDNPTGSIGGLVPGTECLIVAGAISDKAPPPPPDGGAAAAQAPDPDSLLEDVLAGALAFGWLVATAPAEGQRTAIDLTLDSTIDSVIVDPPQALLGVNDGIPMIAQAKDAYGRMVLVAPDVWTWSLDIQGVVRITKTSADPPEGGFGTGPGVPGWALVLATAEGGPVTVTATDSESGVSGAAEVSVSGQGGVELRGQTVSAYDPAVKLGGVRIVVTERVAPASARQGAVLGETYSTTAGDYVIPGLPPGVHRLDVIALDGSGLQDMSFALDIPFGLPEPQVLPLYIALLRPDTDLLISAVKVDPPERFAERGEMFQFHAVALDQSRQPLQLVPTWVTYGPIGHIDETGQFESGDVSAFGAVAAFFGTHAGDARVAVGVEGPLGPPSVVEGMVVDATAPLVPIGGAEVRIVHPSPDGAAAARVTEPPVARAVSSAEGKYLMPEVPPGYYLLEVIPPEGSIYVETIIDIDVPEGDNIWQYVTMVPSDLLSLVDQLWIDPQDALVPPGGTQQYTATILDAGSNPMDLTPTWGTVGPVGRIDGAGVFTAGPTPDFGHIVMAVGPLGTDAFVEVGP